MIQVQYSKIVAYPNQIPWANIMDLKSWNAWSRMITILNGHDSSIRGSRFRMHLQRGPLSTFWATVIECSNDHVAFSGGAQGVACRIDVHATPIDPFQTKISCRIEYTGALLWVYSIFGSMKSIEELVYHFVHDVERSCTDKSTSNGNR
jgi:hypothetical protein